MKYIIEIEDEPLNYDEGSVQLFRVKGFNSLVFDERGLEKLTKYHEPDSESCEYCFYENCTSDEEPCSTCSKCYMNRFIKPSQITGDILERFLNKLDLGMAVECINKHDCKSCKFSKLPSKSKCREKARSIVAEALDKIGSCDDRT